MPLTGLSNGMACAYEPTTRLLELTSILDSDSDAELSFTVSGVVNPISTEAKPGYIVTTYNSDGSRVNEKSISFKVSIAGKLTGMTLNMKESKIVGEPTSLGFLF